MLKEASVVRTQATESLDDINKDSEGYEWLLFLFLVFLIVKIKGQFFEMLNFIAIAARKAQFKSGMILRADSTTIASMMAEETSVCGPMSGTCSES